MKICYIQVIQEKSDPSHTHGDRIHARCEACFQYGLFVNELIERHKCMIGYFCDGRNFTSSDLKYDYAIDLMKQFKVDIVVNGCPIKK